MSVFAMSRSDFPRPFVIAVRACKLHMQHIWHVWHNVILKSWELHRIAELSIISSALLVLQKALSVLVLQIFYSISPLIDVRKIMIVRFGTVIERVACPWLKLSFSAAAASISVPICVVHFAIHSQKLARVARITSIRYIVEPVYDR